MAYPWWNTGILDVIHGNHDILAVMESPEAEQKKVTNTASFLLSAYCPLTLFGNAGKISVYLNKEKNVALLYKSPNTLGSCKSL